MPRAWPGHRGGGRRRTAGSSASSTVALDAVEAVVALLVAEVVVAGEVPAAPLELEPVRVDGALLVVVAERERACGSATAPKSRARFGSAGSGATCTPRSRAPSVTQAAQLEQPLGGGQALDLHRRRGQVQRGQLLGGEAGVAEGVLLPGDAVAVDLRQDAGHRLDPQRDAHRPQLVLVALEGAPERGLVLRVVELPLDLLGRERPPGVEQQSGQVEEALQLLTRHEPTLPSAPSRCSAAQRHRPAAVAPEEQRVLVRAAPHRRDARARASARSAGTSGPSTTRTSWRVVRRRRRRRARRRAPTSG